MSEALERELERAQAALAELRGAAGRERALERLAPAFEHLCSASRLCVVEVAASEVGDTPQAVIEAALAAQLLDDVGAHWARFLADDCALLGVNRGTAAAQSVFNRVGEHTALLEAWLAAIRERGAESAAG